MSKKELLEKCPKCSSLGKIDDDQRQGKVSIICSECKYHYYKVEEVDL